MCRTKAWGVRIGVFGAALAAFSLSAWSADVTRPAEVVGVTLGKTVSDVLLNWPAVTRDAAGNTETVSQYRVYRGTAPDFVPSVGNRIGTPAGPTFTDAAPPAIRVTISISSRRSMRPATNRRTSRRRLERRRR
ncbi:MAG: hypothetical protein U0V87_11775 [Acidobacteriota bacterium]